MKRDEEKTSKDETDIETEAEQGDPVAAAAGPAAPWLDESGQLREGWAKTKSGDFVELA